MKKSLLALSILGTFAGSALAQSSVTIYGVADAGINRYDNGAATGAVTTRIDSGVGNSSRLGFKGTEDLGGGMAAIFTLENGFNIDTGTQSGSALFGRQVFVGLSSNWGAVKLGRQYNPIRVALNSIDPFDLGLAGAADNNFNVHGARADNTINYSTPTLSGFSGQAAYSFGEVGGDSSRGRQYGLSASFVQSPFSVVLAHHKRNLETTATATVPAAVNGNQKSTLLGGTFDFKVVKAHAAFALNKGDSAAGVENLDSRDMMVGVSAPIGAGTVLASYIVKDDRRPANADAKTFALGYMYALSKRTHLYTSYGKTKNDAGSSVGFYGLPVVAGNDPSIFNVGVRHKF